MPVILCLLYFPAVRLPAWLARACVAIAAATYHIYLFGGFAADSPDGLLGWSPPDGPDARLGRRQRHRPGHGNLLGPARVDPGNRGTPAAGAGELARPASNEPGLTPARGRRPTLTRRHRPCTKVGRRRPGPAGAACASSSIPHFRSLRCSSAVSLPSAAVSWTCAAARGINAFVFWMALPALLLAGVARSSLPELLDWRVLAAFYGVNACLFALTYAIGRASVEGSAWNLRDSRAGRDLGQLRLSRPAAADRCAGTRGRLAHGGRDNLRHPPASLAHDRAARGRAGRRRRSAGGPAPGAGRGRAQSAGHCRRAGRPAVLRRHPAASSGRQLRYHPGRCRGSLRARGARCHPRPLALGRSASTCRSWPRSNSW